jgi:rSAM/selenodomain-associated transferase 1
LIASYSRDEDEEERVYKYKELISAANNFSGGDKTKEISEQLILTMKPFEMLTPSRGAEKAKGLCALGIMTKAPEPGKVKTRLTPPLTPEESAKLNICFLRDLSSSIAKASEIAPARGVGIYTPVGSEAVYENILPCDFGLLPQRGEGFGERLTKAVEDLLAIGFQSVCLINSDSPTVLPSTFAEAAGQLSKPGDRIVLGPSDDGGYYLIGLKKLHRAVFEQIDWSTERVFEQTITRASEVGVDVHQLARGFDVDDRGTLQRLCDELLGSDARLEVASHTREFLSELVNREGRGRIWPK